MAKFKEAVLTRKGIALLAKAQAEHKSITFTGAVTGNGDYEDGEDISSRTSLKSEQQTFAPTLIRRQNETNVYVHFTITNYQEGDALEHGYYVTEIGLIANDPDEGEILYGIAIGEPGKCDYLPAYDSLLPAVIGVDFLIEVGNADQVNIVTDLSAYATHEEVEELKTLVDELSLEFLDMSDEAKKMSLDIATIAFQLALKDLIDASDLLTVHVYDIDSASAVTIVSGQYDSTNKKVYI